MISHYLLITDMNKEMLEDKEQKKKKEDKIPMHRIGKPEEIAKVITCVI
jgi:NAD(P)-dependent dehydrogenase (short-subunit alcohol dehydrogenase family)